MAGMLTVAEKEIRDIFTGKRFLILMGIMLLLVLVGIVSGMQSYNTQLDQYKAQQDRQSQDPGFQQMVQQQQKQIEDMKARGESQENIDMAQASLDNMVSPPMPGFLNFFYQFYLAFNYVGVMLAIIMGADLVSGERESGTLRLLLTRPTYRDSVINGKALAGIVVIAIILAGSFLITMAVLLMSQIVPSGDDLNRIIAFFLVTLLFMVAVFAVSLLVSTFSKTSRSAILLMLGLFVFMMVMPGAVNTVSGLAMGPMPQSPQPPIMPMQQYTPPPMDANGTFIATPVPTLSPEMQAYQEAQWKYQNDSINYFKTQQQISDLATLVSPIDSYSRLTNVMLNKQKPWNPSDMYGNSWMFNQQKQLTLFESLQYQWANLIELLVVILAAFGISYMAFMRSDVA
ncbi:MAG: ABC transporter permease subunit [Methanocella sp.]